MRFEKVRKALLEQKGLYLTTDVDARHSGKYTFKYSAGGGNARIAFKTLTNVVEHFDLELED